MKSYKEIADFIGVEYGKDFWIFGRKFTLDDRGLHDIERDIFMGKFPKILASITFSKTIVLLEKPILNYKEFTKIFDTLNNEDIQESVSIVLISVVSKLIKLNILGVKRLKEKLISDDESIKTVAYENAYAEFIQRVYGE